jgi:hypothetical protein
MYTDLQVPRYLRSTALSVILLMGAMPTVTLACEWVCAPAAGQAHQHGEHHHGAGPTEAPDTSAGPSLGTANAPCDHAGDAMAAVTVASVKVFAPGIAPTADHVAVPTSMILMTVASAAASPPGLRARPLSLRI